MYFMGCLSLKSSYLPNGRLIGFGADRLCGCTVTVFGPGLSFLAIPSLDIPFLYGRSCISHNIHSKDILHHPGIIPERFRTSWPEEALF